MKIESFGKMTGFGCRLVSLGVLLLTQTAIFADILPADRVAGWGGNVGVEGGIPIRTTIYTTLPAGSTLSQINSAIAACPSGQVVMLAAGSYSLGGQVIFNGKSGVTLRGAGPGNTVLHFSGSPAYGNILMQGANIYGAVANGSFAGSADWTGGYAQGSSN